MSYGFIVLFVVAALGAYVCSGAQECPPNSSPMLCGSVCEPTCESPGVACMLRDTKKCTTDCRCLEGFLRNPVTNDCVVVEDCPRTQECPSNSSPMLCGSVCEPTCESPGVACMLRDTGNCTTDCRCLDGFVRNPVTNDCVIAEHCRGSGTTTASTGEANKLNAQ